MKYSIEPLLKRTYKELLQNYEDELRDNNIDEIIQEVMQNPPVGIQLNIDRCAPGSSIYDAYSTWEEIDQIDPNISKAEESWILSPFNIAAVTYALMTTFDTPFSSYKETIQTGYENELEKYLKRIRITLQPSEIDKIIAILMTDVEVLVTETFRLYDPNAI